MRVLVVDDTEDVRLLIHAVLGAHGIETVEAPNGPAALAMLADGLTVEVILLDVQMPVMDGWETLRAIRTRSTTADLPVVMCTVKGREPDVVHGLALGCDGYVTKPFDIGHLVGAVREAADTSVAQRRTRRADIAAQLRA